MSAAVLRYRERRGKWPKPETPHTERRNGGFKVGYNVLIWELEYELRYLQVREAVVELDAAPADFRKDGQLYSDARPTSPKVLLTFVLPDVGTLQYACDAYLHWQAALRAISLTLTALRAVDRYSATTGREQYRGFKMLGSGGADGGASKPPMTSDEAADLLARISRMERAAILDDAELAAAAIRIAEKRTHPDAGGAATDFQAVQEAKTVLALLHGDAS